VLGVGAVPEFATLEAQADEALGQLIDAGRRRLVALQRKREELDRQIALEGRRVQAWEQARRSLDDPPPPLRVVLGRLPTKREAVLAFLAEYPDSEFKLVEIRRALIERGAMTNEQTHALEVAVRDMEARDEIRRVRKGIYTLRPRHAEKYAGITDQD
jgi:hypothetical protein